MRKFVCLFVVICVAQTLFAQETKYTIATEKEKWNTDSLGNHRAVVMVNSNVPVAKASIIWRRRDDNPQDKRIIVEDAQTHQKVTNVKTGNITNLSGDIYFQPVSGKGIYYVYYMPYKNEGRSNYPKGVYLKPENTADGNWLQGINSSIKPNATVQEIQAIDSLNSFYPMEVIAIGKETAALTAKSKNKDYIVFPEDRIYPIKMMDYLPYKWVQKGLSNTFKGTADKGENYSFQLGIYALKNINNVSISFSNLQGANGQSIPAAAISCLNNTGIKYDGTPFTNTVHVGADSVQAMWCLVDIPKKIPAGVYKGEATINTNSAPQTINIEIAISNKEAFNGNIAEPWKGTRLKWLNSAMAQENKVIAPYTPLKVNNHTISLLGRKIAINNDGFPAQIQTFFTSEMTEYKDSPNNLLTEPIHFHFTTASGSNMQLQSKGLQFTEQTEGTVTWKATSSNDTLQMDVAASMEFDGFISYTVKLTALQNVSFKDITMHIPFTKEVAKYMMGLGEKGGYRKDSFEWKWDVAHKNQDGAWIGNVNAGLQYSLRDEKYVRPLNTNFYLQKPLLLPTSWGNDNKGGITIGEKGASILANNYSGERTVQKGDTLYYNFTLLITPFHTINTDFQWANRFYHKYNAIDSIKATGATVINIHHATPINPWINYPFIAWQKMKAYIDSAHQNGLKVKIYNTVRELSNHAYETFPMRSLGHEIYSPGKGGGYSWLQEHIDSDYIAAWFVPDLKDAAIVNSGMSRWHNYYVEGMNWLVQNVGIDGIYLDDVAFDRVTMKRIKRVLTADNHPGIIDLHSANQYNKNDGFNNSANLYMEHFPYLNRLWFGEYFDYENNSPDFFLTEVSGIPFGLMGEMLQGGGNPWRGMIYGMTNRMPWSDNADPRPIWKVWDDFGMQGTKMLGYWSDNCPVKTSNDKVLATVYKKEGKALISIASWADSDTTVQLKIDWKALGIDASKATITAPEIKNFQQGKTFGLNDAITVAKNKGWLLIIQ
ncbi:hypothetical protein FC093_12180 [Ilyomonas limi]|uniref:Glycoside hydrolase 123-like N-terminal domain-containing protein n=1 Tax=Ilyomonas limi TaxID=2575867 RepID=A0A4U3KZ79_9BACT|nr:glycoside hydrolase domain-containing protein [Ilyomonas limi]TKK67968.1 hypothetical protein FC093_12180 [Ilyomonas limi]